MKTAIKRAFDASPTMLMIIPSAQDLGMSHCSGNDLIIPQLRLLAPVRSQHLRTRMINWHQQTRVPPMYLSRRLFQSELMIVNAFQRIKRDRSQRHNHSRIDKLDRASQEP